MHELLVFQLQQLGLGPGTPPAAATLWQQVLDCVSHSYEAQDRHHAASLRTMEERLQSLLSLSADWIWEQDAELRFTYVSDGIRAATGTTPAELLGRRRLSDSSFDAEPDAVAAYEAAIRERRPYRDFTFRRIRPDGGVRYIRTSGVPVFDADGSFAGYRGISRDVTEATLAEQKVHELARYDSLTGLPNRSLFLAELERAIARAQRQGGELAVCFIDLDRFKTINDTLGHQAGDELLQAMALRLQATLRKADLVARLGGDEFVLLLEGATQGPDLNTVAHKLLAAIGEPVVLHGCSFLVTGSIGISRYPADGDDAATLLKHADAAMYLAKDQGKNNVQFYTSELADQATRDFELESALRLALVRQELVLHYQPKVDVATGTIRGLEALVRWHHPQRGMVPPGDFIPLAEERGLIVPLGRWVVQQACRQVRDWRLAGLQVPRVAVNVSARQFADEELVSHLNASMATYGVAPDELELELTESVLMADPERANQVLRQLQQLGVHIAIDDFGTGYSSLSYLKRFPARTVKIDRSFIKGLPGDVDDAAITQAVIAMAHSLGLQVVAEGVETAEQLAELRRMGCDEVQGFLLGRPVPAADTEKLLAVRWTEAERAA